MPSFVLLNQNTTVQKNRCSKVAYVDMATFTDQMCATSYDASQMG